MVCYSENCTILVAFFILFPSSVSFFVIFFLFDQSLWVFFFSIQKISRIGNNSFVKQVNLRYSTKICWFRKIILKDTFFSHKISAILSMFIYWRREKKTISRLLHVEKIGNEFIWIEWHVLGLIVTIRCEPNRTELNCCRKVDTITFKWRAEVLN